VSRTVEVDLELARRGVAFDANVNRKGARRLLSKGQQGQRNEPGD
jgi:hypothetical protein